MIPQGETFDVIVRETYYAGGRIYTQYSVLVPDRTISGDFRREHVVTSVPVHTEDD